VRTGKRKKRRGKNIGNYEKGKHEYFRRKTSWTFS
jgi:hypothetical protein